MLKGLEFENRTEYRGIRYAKAARFHAPEMISYAADETVDATVWGNKCYQHHWDVSEFYGREFYADPAYEATESEDCLYLNITVPKGIEAPKGGFPVAVWFHGGAFVNGWSHEIEFDGEGYAKRGVILVTVNYRLGMFGYLCHPALIARDGFTGNYGLRDQLMSIEWVKKHIAMFGGNPDCVSIFGQSAGSMSVESILASEGIEGKLAGAWMMSGISRVFHRHDNMSMAYRAEGFGKFFDSKGISFETLETMPAEDLYALLSDVQAANDPALRLSPVIDGVILKQSYDEKLEGGEFPKIRYMITAAANDIGMGKAGSGLIDGVKEMASILNAQGKPTYVYLFDRALPGDDAGAFHSSDLWYNFGTVRRAWRPLTEADDALSDRMMDADAAFFKGRAPWQKYTPEVPFVKVWDI